MANKLLRVFLDTDMRAGHNGLSKVALKDNVNVADLKEGQHIVFVNKKADKIKIYSAKNIVSYLLSGSRLELSSLNYFADCFGADGFKYDKALKTVLEQKLRV